MSIRVVMVYMAEFVWAGLAESVTCTVKVEEPAVVGVPEMTPADDRAKPEGRLPDVIE
jgi:hypothetical protein